jgi:hypothetical protein
MRKTVIFIIFGIFFIVGPLLYCRADLDLTQNSVQTKNDLAIASAFSKISTHLDPKLANLYYKWDIPENAVEPLSRYDILIFDMENQVYSPDKLKRLKQLNPDIILLVYLAPEEIRGDSGQMSGTMRKKLFNKIASKWWLRDDSGDVLAWWDTNTMINITRDAGTSGGKSWAQTLAEFVDEELLDTGYWDGVFYDNVWSDVSFLSYLKMDFNQDGRAESVSEMNSKWKDGMIDILKETRAKIGSSKLIFGNGGEYYKDYLNGVLYENFPEKGWASTMNNYKFVNENIQYPSIGIINANTDNSGKSNDYQKMRFGLASSLMHDGYSSFDDGDESHDQYWWYDEYESALGAAVDSAKNLTGSSGSFVNGVWRRNYKNGLAIVNSSNSSFKVELGGEYEKIHGTQDPYTNSGFFVEKVTVPLSDGLVLLRSIEKIVDTTYFNGSFARIYNQYGSSQRSGFFAYNDKFRGGNQVIETDINNDGKDEFVVASVNQVKIYDYLGREQYSFYPYTERYSQGVNITVGDLDNNGTMEIITGTEHGGGPHVRVFNSKGVLINPGFFAYAENFRGGVNITVGDLDGNGTQEIIAGAGVGGGPHVRVFNSSGKLINPGFFAYDKAFRGGVNVVAADINGDGRDEIITGPGKGGSPQVKVFNNRGEIVGPVFFAFDEKLRDGVEVAASDVDGDGLAEIIATTRDVFTLSGF